MKLIKFEKDDCVPCSEVSKYLDSKNIQYERINAFNNPQLAVKFKVRGVPTLILLDEENEIDRIVGFDVAKIDSLLEKLG